MISLHNDVYRFREAMPPTAPKDENSDFRNQNSVHSRHYDQAMALLKQGWPDNEILNIKAAYLMLDNNVQDQKMIKEYFTKAAEEGVVDAYFQLGLIHQIESDRDLKNIVFRPLSAAEHKKKQDAFDCFKKAADQQPPHISACEKVGIHYF